MRLPDFVIIGAAKAGTTSLHAALTRHPDIFLPEQKEPEFFARDDLYSQGLDRYADHFSAAEPHQMIGEASTLYSLSPLFPHTAGRIKTHLPEVKLIYIMRHPVDRAFSFYQQVVKNYQNASGDLAIHRTFEDCILPERLAEAAPRDKIFAPFDAHLPDTPEFWLAGSDYVTQIEAYLAHFPRSRMLFLTFEDYRRDPGKVLRQITDFLGRAPLPDQALTADATRVNVARDHFQGHAEAQAVAQVGAKLGPLWTARKLVPEGLRQRLRQQLARQIDPDLNMPPQMEPATRAALSARYSAQLPALRTLTGLDLSDWRFESHVTAA